MTTYTKAEADAAQAKITQDQAALDAARMALSDAQAQIAAANAAATSAQSAIDSAAADMQAEQAIVDAFNAQPPPIVVPPAGPYTMPDVPAFPKGPFTKHGTMKVSATNNKIYLPTPVEFAGNYICINHTDPSVVLQQLEILEALVDAQGGSLFYSGSMCGGVGAKIGVVGCKKTRTGRPFLRFCGKWPGLISIDDLTAIYDTTPNTHTGDIATGAQFGNKAAGEAIESVWIKRALTQGIYDNWGSGKYDNGDTLTTERTVHNFRVDHATSLTAPDACIDTKARHTIAGYLYAKDSREVFKGWDDMTAKSAVCINPKVDPGSIGGASGLRCMGAPSRHFDPSDKPPVWDIDQFWYESPTFPAIRIENGPVEIHIKTGHIDAPKVLFTTNNGSLHPNSTLNGSAFPK